MRAEDRGDPGPSSSPSGADSARRTSDGLLIVVFCVTISTPLVVTVLSSDPVSHASERRAAVRAPSLRLKPLELIGFPRRLNTYFADNFGLRHQLIRAHSIVKVEYLNVSSSRKVVLGKDGWLFLADSLAQHRLAPLTSRELRHWKDAIEASRARLRARGVFYLPVLVPDKCTLYPEYLPERSRRVTLTSRLSQLVKYLDENSDLELLDLLTLLREAKPDGQLYFKTDTHWNHRGIDLAYRAILERINRWHTETRAIPPSEFRSERHRYTGDLAAMLGLEDRLSEVAVRLVPRSPRHARWANRVETIMVCARGTIPRVLIFCDSFGLGLRPWLSEHFGRARYVAGPGLDARLIEDWEPDYRHPPDHRAVSEARTPVAFVVAPGAGRRTTPGMGRGAAIGMLERALRKCRLTRRRSRWAGGTSPTVKRRRRSQ